MNAQTRAGHDAKSNDALVRLLSRSGSLSLTFHDALSESASCGCAILPAKRLVSSFRAGSLACHLEEFAKKESYAGMPMLKAGFWSSTLLISEAPGMAFGSSVSCLHEGVRMSVEMPCMVRGMKGAALALDYPDFRFEKRGDGFQVVFRKDPEVVEGFPQNLIGYYRIHDGTGIPCGAGCERSEGGTVPSGMVFALRSSGPSITPVVVIAEYKFPILTVSQNGNRPSRVSVELDAILSSRYSEYGAFAEPAAPGPPA